MDIWELDRYYDELTHYYGEESAFIIPDQYKPAPTPFTEPRLELLSMTESSTQLASLLHRYRDLSDDIVEIQEYLHEKEDELKELEDQIYRVRFKNFGVLDMDE